MRAVVKTEPGHDNMTLKQVEEPQATGNLVKIEIAYTGICGTDIHTFSGEYRNSQTPITLGHEFSGVVSEVGPEVTEFRIGDRVVSETTFEVCGECDFCKEKDYNLCANRCGIGTVQDGSFADYLVAPESSVHHIPESVSLKAATLSEPLACCTHPALEKTTINENDTVLIIGPGPIGLLLLQVVKSQGAKVIISGITQDQSRLDLAKELGADCTIDSQANNLEELVLAETDGYGADKVFDCSGAVPAVNAALPLTRKKGTFVQVGIFADKYTKLDTESIIQREINYVGSRSQKPSSWDLALGLLENGNVDANKMITKVYDLDNWREAFEAVIGGHEIKVLVASNSELDQSKLV